MTEWIEFSHDWAYYITSDTFTMNKVANKVPAGAIVLTKEQELLDTGVTITKTDYKIVRDGTVVDLEDKRAVSKILTALFIDYMKKEGEYPPGASYGKTFKNGNVEIDFKASEYDKFKVRLTPADVGGDPDEFVLGLKKAGRKKFIPGDDWKIEPAKSSRATCKTCGQKIDKNHLRLGEPSYFQDHLSYKWHHFACKVDEIWGIPEGNLDGYESLAADQKDQASKALWE